MLSRRIGAPLHDSGCLGGERDTQLAGQLDLGSPTIHDVDLLYGWS